MNIELPEFCCPLCKGALASDENQYVCSRCQRSYPVVLGIPDFRVFPDPYIDYESDYQKGAYLLENSRALNFQDTVRLYWKITPHVSEDRAERFARRAFALVDKGRANLNEIESLNQGALAASQSVLEIGCGTGGLLVAAAGQFQHVIGLDIAFRWLIVARKRLEEAGLQIPLVCACAEHLPFKDGGFDLIVAENVIEHVRDQQAALRECRRVSRPGALAFLVTPNRFTIALDQHVQVWGVGFLPRSWMAPYVKLVKGIAYEHLRVLSLPELKRLLRKAAYHDHRITLPAIPPAELKHFSPVERAQVAVYDLLRKTPLLRLALYLFGPSFHALCRAGEEHE